MRIQVLGAFSHTLTLLPAKVWLLTLPSVMVFYFRLLVVPAGLSPFYDTPYIKTASFTGFFLPLLELFAIGGMLVCWVLRQRKSGQVKASRQTAFFVCWMVILLVPALNLAALDMGEIAHDRYLYLPSIGFCALVAIGMKQAAEHLQVSATFRRMAVASVAVVLLRAAAIAQSAFWKDDLQLYKRGASIAQSNLDAQNNLANIYFENGDFEHGIATHQRILKVNPSFVDSYFNLGVAYYKLGDQTQAQSYLRQAISMRPSPESYFYLGLAQFKTGDMASAREKSLRTAAQWGRQQPDFHAALGRRGRDGRKITTRLTGA